MKHLFFAFTCIFLLCTCKTKPTDSSVNLASKPLSSVNNITTLAFGSCSDEDQDQSFWKEISKNSPQLWIWGGDNIYGDTKDMSIMEKKYKMQKNNPYYQEFKSSTAIIGTWDDHDYGDNDGNKTFSMKTESKQLMLDFLDVPAFSNVRNREGVYMKYLFGESGKRIKVILLDTRSFQDVLEIDPSGKARYLPTETGDLLGKAQWDWLENELYINEADIHIIMSSIQFAAEKHGYEKWSNFPSSKKKMMDIIHFSHANNVMFLSGDRHIGEISRLMVDSLDYPLYDITSSGLTHSYKASKEINPYRIGDLVVDENYGLLLFNWQEDHVDVTCQLKGMAGQTYVNELLGSFKIY